MEGLATEAGKAFLTQGILGVARPDPPGCGGLPHTARARASDQKRFDELQKIIEARETVAKALGTNSLALEANNKAMEARTRATEEMAREVAPCAGVDRAGDAEGFKTNPPRRSSTGILRGWIDTTSIPEPRHSMRWFMSWFRRPEDRHRCG